MWTGVELPLVPVDAAIEVAVEEVQFLAICHPNLGGQP